MVRKLSLICAVAAAVLFPLAAFAAEGQSPDQGHKSIHENGPSHGQVSQGFQAQGTGTDSVRARGPIITVDMPMITTMGTIAITGTITIIGTNMQRPDIGIMVNGGTTA